MNTYHTTTERLRDAVQRKAGAKSRTLEDNRPQPKTIQRKAAAAPSGQGVFQLVRSSRPPGLSRTARKYTENGLVHWRDGAKHYVQTNGGGGWRKLKTKAVSLHNRVKFNHVSGRGAPRKGSFRSKHGSGARYNTGVRRRRALHFGNSVPIKHANPGTSNYTTSMRHASGFASATIYPDDIAAPATHVFKNLLYLLCKGGGGKNTANNLVAASTHANSEHLLMERILYHYKGKGLSVNHTYEKHNGQLIAKSMRYDVFHNGLHIFRREVNGFRRDKPSSEELKAVENQLQTAIAKAFNGG